MHIGSQNRGILQRVKELEPDISTVYIAHDLGEDDYDLDYADSYSIEGKNLTTDMVEAHPLRRKIRIWLDSQHLRVPCGRS